MKKISLSFFFLILSSLLFSCSKDYYFNRNQAYISNELKVIKNSDQTVRNYTNLVDRKYSIRTFETVIDSLSVKGMLDKMPNINTLNIQPLDLQISKFSEKEKESYYEERINGAELMNIIDEINRRKLYKIIRKNGYPSYYNRKWQDSSLRVGVTFILTHTDFDSEMGKKTLKLMLKEFKKGRVAEGEMQHYLWSADGRVNGYPYDYKIDLNYWYKKLNE